MLTRAAGLIDHSTAGLSVSDTVIEDVGWEIFQLIPEATSGKTQVAADRLGLHNDLVLFNPAPVT